MPENLYPNLRTAPPMNQESFSYVIFFIYMPENLYLNLWTAPPMNQESFSIEMVRKYYQDIANLKEKYTEKQRRYKNAYKMHLQVQALLV